MFSSAFAEPLSLEVNGETYKVSPLRIGDFAKLESHLKSKILGVAMKQAEQIVDPVIRKEVIDSALKQTNSINIFSQGTEAQNFLSSVEGIIQILYLSLSRNHKDITADKVEDIISSLGNPETLGQIVLFISGIGTAEEAKKKLEEQKKNSTVTN